MHRLRRKLTYANVASTLALFLVVAGGSALAANQLAKNSVGTKQLKKNAVTTAKIKNRAVTGSKIAAGTITGAQVDSSSLGTVPSATNASHAGSADTAGVASNANALGGAPATAYARTELEPEHLIGAPGQPAFEHGCANVGAGTSPAGFYKDPFGVVHLRAFISGCQEGQSGFTLPPGFRPSEITVGPTGTGNSSSGLVRIDPTGVVSFFGSLTQVYTDVAFRTN